MSLLLRLYTRELKKFGLTLRASPRTQYAVQSYDRSHDGLPADAHAHPGAFGEALPAEGNREPPRRWVYASLHLRRFLRPRPPARARASAARRRARRSRRNTLLEQLPSPGAVLRRS